MNNYLTIKKILIDSVALYKKHFLYITVLIGAVLGPYSIIVRMDDLPNSIIIIIPIFLYILMMVEIVSTGLISTSYVDRSFVIWEEIKSSFRRTFKYILLTLLATVLTFFGLSILVLPGIIITIFFNLVKIDFVVTGSDINKSFNNVFNLLKKGNLVKVLLIYSFPLLLQILLALVLNPFFDPTTFEENLYTYYPYITLALVIIYPISLCFRVSLYFNLIKSNQLDSSNELV